MTVSRLAVLLFVASCVAASLSPAFAHGVTERVSVSSVGEEGNECSACYPSFSADGRYVAFISDATNLVEGDSNGEWDVFVRDREAGTTERVSVNSAEQEGNAYSWWPAISADGRYVAFDSNATNLVEEDSNGCPDVFVRDRETGTTERVSVSSGEGQGSHGSCGPSISADGRYVAFYSFANNLVPGDTNVKLDVFVRDRLAGTTERVSTSSAGGQANGDSGDPYNAGSHSPISADGRYVAFSSIATNLVEGDGNGAVDIFVHDRDTGTTERVSVSSAGEEANGASGHPAISADGRYVVFLSGATNLVAGDTNGRTDIFLRDRQIGTTERVSLSSDGAEANGSSEYPAVSADGRRVAFHSWSTNLVASDANGVLDVFVRDRLAGTTKRVSVSTTGAEGSGPSWYCCISDDGRYVCFSSEASNLVIGDANAKWDVFVRGLSPYPVPDVLLEVHPNERAPGASTTQYLGKEPWTQPSTTPAATYWWKLHEFAAHGPLWIQLCAQNWDSAQKGYAGNDRTKLQVNGLVPTDYDLIQTGAPGSWQWLGKNEKGKRVTLRFLVPTTPGKQALWIGAGESPVLWWLKVIDLEPDVIEPF